MLIGGTFVSMALIWLLAAIIFAVIEALTMGIATIWFAGGAIVAMILALLDLHIGIQVAGFLIVSVILLVCTRKLFVNKLKTGTEKTNVDAVIGQKALVQAEIKPLSTGIIKIGGQEWTAISANDEIIPAGETVVVIEIQGVKAVVKKEQ